MEGDPEVDPEEEGREAEAGEGRVQVLEGEVPEKEVRVQGEEVRVQEEVQVQEGGLQVLA